MLAVFRPSVPRGVTEAPPSKSMAHRLLICAGLCDGESLVQNVALSDDIRATLDCLGALGAACEFSGGDVRVRGRDLSAPFVPQDMDCRESGSTLRFFIPLCLLSRAPVTLKGSASLFRRPLAPYQQLCARHGLAFIRGESSVTLRGPLTGGSYEVAADVSSQFVSGLLFALPLLAEDSRVVLLPPVESRPYIDMTVQALSAFGVRADWADEHTLVVPGAQRYAPSQARVEGDYSNAAFFQALDLLGGRVTVNGLDPQSRQGDRVAVECFERLRQGPATIDIADCPDLGPVLLAAAAALHGGTLTGTRRLRLKESDRGAAMGEELKKFGVRTTAGENSITVEPGGLRAPKETLFGHNDHRVVMALSVLAARFGGRISGAEAVRKSLPDFFERLRSLGVEVETEETAR